MAQVLEDREPSRRHYSRNLRRYLEANKRKEISGSKSDFDRTFFLEQIELTAEAGEAERRVERACEHARAVGIKLKDDLGDRSDDGYDDISDCGEDLLWELKKDAIKDWADSIDVVFVDGEPRAIGEDSLSVMDGRTEPGSKPVHAFSDGIQPYMDDIFEDPDRRKAIDRYIQKMERLRVTMVLRELHWWEECCGI